MKHGDSLRAVSELEPGDHLCCLYETEADHRAVLTPFLRQGLERGEKVLYVVDARTAEIVLDYLRDDGLDVLPYLASGQLKILTADEAYTQGGAFSPDRMMDMLSQETQRALQEGYRALRVTGEMSWALRGLPGSDRLIEYEARLNEFFPNHPALGLCQYDQRRFAADVLLNVLRTHPMAIVGQVVYDNFYYVPPDEMLGEHLPSVELHHWLVSLAERWHAQQALHHERNFVTAILDTVGTLVVVLDRQGRIVRFNRACEQLTGYSFDEVRDKLLWEQLLLPEERLSVQGVFDRLVTGDFPNRFENHWVAKDGRHWLIDWSNTVLLDARGAVEYVIGTGIDVTERQQIAEVLKRYQLLSEHARDIILFIRRDGRILEANTAAIRAYSYSREELLSLTIQHLRAAETQPLIAPQMEQAAVTGILFETTHRRKDGSTFPVEVSSRGMPLGGEVVLLSIIRDITERKRAQQEIESLARFPSENPNPVLRLNRDGLILYANAASQALLTEWSRAQGDYAPVFWQDLVARSLANQTGASVDVECGEQVYSLIVAPVAGAGYVNLYGTDITARKRAEEALQRRNRELALLNRAGQGLASTLDPHHVLEQLLRAVAEMIEAEGSSVWLLDDEQPGRLVCQASTCPGSKRSPVGLYLKIGQGVVGWVVQNGKCALVPSAPDDPRFSPEIDELIGFRTTSLLAVPLRVRDDVIGVLEVVNKLSGELNDDDSSLLETLAVAAASAVENARLIETLRQRTDELLARNQELDTFAHTAAHDLKTPLSLIVGYAELMKDDPQALSDELRHTLQAITRNARKMSYIIDDLLLLAEVRSADMRLEPIFMPAVLAEVQERLALDIREYHAEIVMPETTMWPMAWGYAPWVEEVWANYMSNALKYGGRPPRVELGAMPLAEGQVRFWVRDNGLGLSPEDQARLFLPFAKLGQARAKGHGLGLSIVRRIVEKLGGQVGVESRVGQGSVFSFTLPSVPV